MTMWNYFSDNMVSQGICNGHVFWVLRRFSASLSIVLNASTAGLTWA